MVAEEIQKRKKQVNFLQMFELDPRETVSTGEKKDFIV